MLETWFLSEWVFKVLLKIKAFFKGDISFYTQQMYVGFQSPQTRQSIQNLWFK